MIQIGNIELSNQVALAPMAGVTDLPFRKLCKELGAGYAVGEMLASEPLLRRSRKSQLRGVHLDEAEPRTIQIVGWDPQTMADSARFNVDQGASIIDINMGCPAKKVCKREAGSALLADPDLVAKILEAVVSAVCVPVTLKIRTGIDPSHRNAVEIARIAQQCGIQGLAVHGRTRACKFNGSVEYQTIREICQSVSIPVFANGDIESFTGATQVLEFTGAEGVMVGRAAHGAPWFPGQLAEYMRTGKIPQSPSLCFQKSVVLSHLDHLHHFYGNAQGVRIVRKHIKWYTNDHPDSGSFRQLFNRIDTPRRQLEMVSNYYNQLVEKIEKASFWQKNPPLTNLHLATAHQINSPTV